MSDNANEETKPVEKATFWSAVFGGAALISVLLACLGVVSRYVLKVSLPWVEELLRYLFIWLIFICSALSFREGTLISITMLHDGLKKYPLARRILEAVINLVILAFALASLYTGWEMMSTQFEFEELSTVLEINMGWVTLGALIGYAFFAIFSLMNLFRLCFGPDNFISIRIRRSVRGFFPEK